MEKKQMLDKIEAAKKDIEENGATDILIITKAPDGAGFYCAADPLIALGLADVAKMKTKNTYQDLIKGNEMNQMFHDLFNDSQDSLDDSDED
ncbi:hypothetical protein [Lactobacillus sp. HT06-2]|uniref:hypothetical protein n=1 Tax=Lactobacillus sp. HT06-2 TaxID=2080222 RepID=UPI000CD7F3BF|nr:hypothetical protein [Lactobacillus sp. HT06-2]